ncbi:hypothetical protein [Streptomyces sp. NPDC002671]
MTSMLGGCTPWPEEFVDRYWAAGHWRGNTLGNGSSSSCRTFPSSSSPCSR